MTTTFIALAALMLSIANTILILRMRPTSSEATHIEIKQAPKS